MARKLLRVDDAPNEGARRLRELLRTRSSTMIARRIQRDPTSVRRWAKGDRTPDPESRERMEQELDLSGGLWERSLAR